MHEVEQRRSSCREPAPVAPPTHVLGRLRAEQADGLEKPQHPVAHEILNYTDVALVELGGGMQSQPPVRVLAEGAFDDTNVEVQVRVLPFGHTSAEPNRWQGLFLQSFCISAIHGGQMKVTAPKRAITGAPGQQARSWPSSARSATASTRPTSAGSRCEVSSAVAFS